MCRHRSDCIVQINPEQMCQESSNKGVNSNYVALSFLGRWASYNRKSQPRNSDKLYEQVLIACKQEAMNGKKKKTKKKTFHLSFIT